MTTIIMRKSYLLIVVGFLLGWGVAVTLCRSKIRSNKVRAMRGSDVFRLGWVRGHHFDFVTDKNTNMTLFMVINGTNVFELFNPVYIIIFDFKAIKIYYITKYQAIE